MCSQSIAEENLLPHAYMYSILFMLGMPATVFTGFGVGIWLKFRRYDQMNGTAAAPDSTAIDTAAPRDNQPAAV